MASETPTSIGQPSIVGGGKTINPTGSSHLAYTMAALTAFGGAGGYMKAKSTQSLVAGLVFGGAFSFAGYMIQTSEEVRGFRFACANSVLLAGAMAMRYQRTRKPMPAIPLVVIASGSAVYHGMKWQEWSE